MPGASKGEEAVTLTYSWLVTVELQDQPVGHRPAGGGLALRTSHHGA